MQPRLDDRTATRRPSTPLVCDLGASGPLRAAPGSTCLRQRALGALLLSLSISRRRGAAASDGLTGVRPTNVRKVDISGFVRRARSRTRLYRPVPRTRRSRTLNAATQTRQEGLYGSRRLCATATLNVGAPGRLRRASAPDLASHSPSPRDFSTARPRRPVNPHSSGRQDSALRIRAVLARPDAYWWREERGRWGVFPRHAPGLSADSRTSLRRRGAFLARIRARVRSDPSRVATRDFGVPRVLGRRWSGGTARDLPVFPFSCM